MKALNLLSLRQDLHCNRSPGVILCFQSECWPRSASLRKGGWPWDSVLSDPFCFAPTPQDALSRAQLVLWEIESICSVRCFFSMAQTLPARTGLWLCFWWWYCPASRSTPPLPAPSLVVVFASHCLCVDDPTAPGGFPALLLQLTGSSYSWVTKASVEVPWV